MSLLLRHSIHWHSCLIDCKNRMQSSIETIFRNLRQTFCIPFCLIFWIMEWCHVVCKMQCCGYMTFWCGSRSGSGSADPCLWLIDPDPAIFVVDLQDANKKVIFLLKVFLLIIFGRYIYIIFKEKKWKRSHKAVGIKVFLTIFDWW